eukprot:3101888-Rhodomonas_salina.1
MPERENLLVGCVRRGGEGMHACCVCVLGCVSMTERWGCLSRRERRSSRPARRPHGAARAPSRSCAASAPAAARARQPRGRRMEDGGVRMKT